MLANYTKDDIIGCSCGYARGTCIRAAEEAEGGGVRRLAQEGAAERPEAPYRRGRPQHAREDLLASLLRTGPHWLCTRCNITRTPYLLSCDPVMFVVYFFFSFFARTRLKNTSEKTKIGLAEDGTPENAAYKVNEATKKAQLMLATF